jgi:DNA-nicking Smr family endonuclease
MDKTVDIHGMTTTEAKKLLEQIISSAPLKSEITVIHGYHGGQALQNMVRKGLKHKRIKQKILSMNFGETILILE